PADWRGLGRLKTTRTGALKSGAPAASQRRSRARRLAPAPDDAPRRGVKTKVRWIIGGASIATLVAVCGWLVLTDAPAYQFLVRLYVDKRFLKHTLREWGVLAPVIFMGLQALQVIIAPIPGELTGILGGYLFGEWVGLLYSTIGLTLGSGAAFAVGRWLGARYVRKLVSADI